VAVFIDSGDHIHVHSLLGEPAEERAHGIHGGRHAYDVHPHLVAVRGHSGHHRLFQPFGKAVHHVGPPFIGEGRRAVQIDRVFFCYFHRPRVEHLRPQRGELEHLVEGDVLQLSRPGAFVRVAGVHTGHIAVDLAWTTALRRDGNRRGVGPSPAKRCKIPVRGYPLETGDDDDAPHFELPLQLVQVQVHDPGVAEIAGRGHLKLERVVGERRNSKVAQRHRQKGGGHLLSRCEEHVQLAGRRLRRHLLREGDERIRGLSHRGDYHDELLPLVHALFYPGGDVLYLLGRGHRRPAVLLHDHFRFSPLRPTGSIT